MKKVYECCVYYEYKRLISTDSWHKFYRYILASTKEEALEKYKNIESKYDTRPYGARKILVKEYEAEEYTGDLVTLKEEMEYKDYLQLIRERLYGMDIKKFI